MMKKEIIAFTAATMMMASSWAAERVYLGTKTAKTTEAVQAQLKLGEEVGHTILFVEPGSPADKAGFQKNDIIVSINARKIKNFQQLNKTIGAVYEKNEQVEIAYLRKGEEKKVNVTLGAKEVNNIFSSSSNFVKGDRDMPKQIQDMIDKVRNGQMPGGSSSNMFGGVSITTMMVDGEHKIAVSSNGKDKKHIKVTNTNTKEVEFDGDIIGDDYSKVPEDLQEKVKKASKMLGGINMKGGPGGVFQLNLGEKGKDQPKAKDDSSDKVDDFIKELEIEEKKDK